MELKKYKLGEIADIIGGVAYRPSDICDYGVVGILILEILC